MRRCSGTAAVGLLCLVMWGVTPAPGAQAKEDRPVLVCSVAKKMTRPPGAPKYSDVSMRLFHLRKDRDLIAAGKAFHITRGDWSYIKDADFIKQVRELGWSFQGTTNAVTRDPDQALKDKGGKPVLDHFKKPGRYWADWKNEKHREWYLAELKRWAALGVDSIQRDEPTAIRHWSVSNAAAFFKDMHRRFEKEIGRKVPMSCNLAWNRSMFGGRGWPIAKLFDFGMAEMNRRDVNPTFLRAAALDARKRGKFLMYTTYHKLGVPTYRRAIAGCYANGMLFIVPWDQFAGTRSPRVFSRPEDLADVYGFVRANAALLDGYEDAAVAGHGLKETRYGKTPPLALAKASQVSSWVRARPGKQGEPVVVHLVNWGRRSTLTVKVRAAMFFAGAPLRVELRTPAPYDGKAHATAEQKRDYSGLSVSRQLTVKPAGEWSVIDVPALDVWGVLLVSPAGG